MSTRASRRAGSASRHAEAARVLYLSYDGMCDPLGASQVLPYLTGLAARGHAINLISFEKPDRSEAERAAVQGQCDEAGVAWHPLAYHKRPPILSAMYDLWRMESLAMRLERREPFDIVHCRSYLAALVGLRMKRRTGTRFLFDMRGFWADERVDGGLWNLRNPLFRLVFDYFKRREADFLREADHVVSLTEAGRRILLERRHGSQGTPITVIPCCVDFEAFAPVRAKDRAAARKALDIPSQATVAAYLGSFGSWYLVDDMLAVFRVQLETDPEARFLIVTREPAAEILAAAKARGVPSERVIVRAASRAEVPALMAAADYGLFFIKPAFSKKASSPTKMGELLALELPMITNGEVGDVAQIVDETGAGVVVTGFDEGAYRSALDELSSLKPDMAKWRAGSKRWFDLATGIDRYDSIYRALAADRAA